MVDHLLELLDRAEVIVRPIRLARARLRVVAEIESSTPGTSEMIRRHSVVLPAPEGLEITSMIPRRGRTRCVGVLRGDHSTF